MLVYKGDISKLKRLVDEHQKRARRAYTTVFGERMARRLAHFAEELLDEKSFPSKGQDPLAFSLDSERNRFAVASMVYFDLGIAKEGRFSPGQITTAPFFEITEEALIQSETKPPYIGSFMHEFNHFLAFALAPRPLAIICQLMMELFGGSIDFSDHKAFFALVEKIAKATTRENREEQKKKIRLLMNAIILWNFEEKATRVVDYLLFREMGYDVEPPAWLGKEKKFVTTYLPPPLNIVAGYPVDGDPFLNFDSTLKIARALPNWPDYLKPTDELARNLQECYLQCDVRRIRYSKLRNLVDSKEAK